MSECRIVFGTSAGIKENTERPATLFKKNLETLNRILDSSQWNGIKRLCFIGSSCMYPLDGPQPYKEDSLGTGEVEPTSAPFAYSKLAGWQLCKAISKEFKLQYFVAIPSDVYGDPTDSHFIGDLIRKFHRAKEQCHKSVTLWGTGSPVRQPLYDEDFSAALKFICENYHGTEPINIAPIETYSIARVASLIRDIVGYSGDISFDCSKPDGQLKKTLDNLKLMKLGCTTFTSLEEGLKKAYGRFLNEKGTDIL